MPAAFDQPKMPGVVAFKHQFEQPLAPESSLENRFEQPPAFAQKLSPDQVSPDQVGKLMVSQLRVALGLRGPTSSGKRNDLVDRLNAWFSVSHCSENRNGFRYNHFQVSCPTSMGCMLHTCRGIVR